MSLFDLIRYPVDSHTVDFNHIPEKIWDEYRYRRNKMSFAELRAENLTNKLLIQTILEHEE